MGDCPHGGREWGSVPRGHEIEEERGSVPRGDDGGAWVVGRWGGEIIGNDNFGAGYFANDKFTISLHGQQNDILSATSARKGKMAS